MPIDFAKRPPRELLKAQNAFVSSDSPFRSWCRLKQSIYRQKKGWACGTDGRIDLATGKPRLLGNYLVDADARVGYNFITNEIAESARNRVTNPEEGNNIEEIRLFSNMLTSQALCFNLFLPQILNPVLATTIWSAVYEDDVANVLDVKVEHSPGRRHAQLGIGDKSAFDAMVLFERPDKERGILAIETKYTDSFSPAPRSEKKYSAIAGANKCDADRARDALVGSGIMTDAGWSRALKMKTQQLWRTHALAATMRSGDRCPHICYVVVHASGDNECTNTLSEYDCCLSNQARNQRSFRQLTLENLAAIAHEVLAGEHRTWIMDFTARYLDWNPVDDSDGICRA